MAVKIKLKRLGKIHAPQYRIVVADSRTARNGRAIEEIGIYQPMNDPSIIKVDSERVQYWLGVGAQPTDAVAALLKVTGDWQKFKGLPGAEGTLQVAPPKENKLVAYEAAVAEAAKEPKSSPRKKLEQAVETAAEAIVVAEVAEEIAEAAAEAAIELAEAGDEIAAEVAAEIAVEAAIEAEIAEEVAEEALAEAVEAAEEIVEGEASA